MRRANGNNDAEAADIQPPLEVGNININLAVIFRAGATAELAQYIFCQGLKDIITDASYNAAKIGFSHHANETIDRAMGGVSDETMRRCNIQRCLTDLDMYLS